MRERCTNSSKSKETGGKSRRESGPKPSSRPKTATHDATRALTPKQDPRTPTSHQQSRARLVIPPAGQPLKFYAEIYLEWEIDSIFHDRDLGRLRWLQGKALLLARDVCKHGEWGKYLQAIDIGESTAYLQRRIATVIPAEESISKSYTEMLAIIMPNSFGKKALETESEKSEGRSDSRKNGGSKKSTQSKFQSFRNVLRILQKVRNDLRKETEKKFDDACVEDLASAITFATMLRNDCDALINRWGEDTAILRDVKSMEVKS